jgi:hypothetical protein
MKRVTSARPTVVVLTVGSLVFVSAAPAGPAANKQYVVHEVPGSTSVLRDQSPCFFCMPVQLHRFEASGCLLE